MIRKKKFSSVICAALSVFAWALASSCDSKRSGHDEQALWFVHATDPHIYLELKNPTDPKKPTDPKEPDDSKPESIWNYQQNHDDETFKNFFQKVSTLPHSGGPPAFIVITGDFGVDPCLILSSTAVVADSKHPTAKECLGGVDQNKRTERVDKFVERFAASAVRDIYFVAGNNDLPLETADDAGLGYFNQFFQDVQTKISAKSADIRLHNLTGCYGPNGGTISACASDIPGRSYRLIGFPSYSFKNKDTKYSDNQTQQTAQLKTFRDLLEQAVTDGKKVLIVTHIPEMDDPYFLARERYDGVKPTASADTDKDNPRSPYSTWNVQKSVLDEWTKVLASDSVIAVLAGHLHDGHKEIYQRPYSWSTLKDHQMGYRKLFLAPPLSVKAQNGSPIQARGFSVVTLKADHLSNRFYWYEGLTRTFHPEQGTEIAHPRHPRWLARVFGVVYWIWELDQDDSQLERACILLVALMAAFLTLVAVWQIPPTDNPLAKKPTGEKDKKDDTKGAVASSPFSNAFGKTVIAGLGGLIFTDIAKSISGKPLSDGAKCFYIVWFIVFFFLLILLWSIFSSIAEAVRSRIAVIHYPLARPPRPPRGGGNGADGGGKEKPTPFRDWFFYWFMRTVHWFFSLRVPVLTFFDTFINLIQGKNQTTTRALAEVVIDQQKNLIRVADTIRKNLNDLIESKMDNPADSGTISHVRVSISVLSADQSSVFYISRAPASSLLAFTKRSVAWVSVFTGQIRWWAPLYKDKADKILLFDNSKGIIAGDEEKILLSTHYQDRLGDYRAFALFPIPWPQRSFGSKYVKGAIHISFRDENDIYKIWNKETIGPTIWDPERPSLSTYPSPHRMLEDWCLKPDVRAALQHSVFTLGELLYGFNEIIYRDYIEPDRLP
jgi:hypothetical protein